MKIKTYIIFSLFFTALNASAHNHSAYSHSQSDPRSNRSAWMGKLDQTTRLNKLNIPGTHNSGAKYGWHSGDITRNQVLTIGQQLNAGIRFMDIRLRHIGNSFEIYHGPVYQILVFNQVLSAASAFLNKNPSETIYMRVKEEHTPSNNTQNFEDTFKTYADKYSHIIWNPVNNNPSLSETKGKIVFLQNFTTIKYRRFGINYGLLNAQDDHHVTTNWDLYSKWEKIKSHIVLSNKNANQYSSPYINYLSASGGSFPYFIASGHSSPGTSAPRLSTGKTTPGWKYSYPDFPRVSCFIGICTIAFEGTNILTYNYLKNNNISYAGIIAADFPGQGLIDAVIDLNKIPYKPLRSRTKSTINTLIELKIID